MCGLNGQSGQSATKAAALGSNRVDETVTRRFLEANSVMDYPESTASARTKNAVSQNIIKYWTDKHLIQRYFLASICELESSAYSGSSSGDESGSAEPDYNICCPPLKVYIKKSQECCREYIDDTSASGDDGNETISSASSAVGSTSGSTSGCGSGSGSGSGSGGCERDDDLYYDCESMSYLGYIDTSIPSGSGTSPTDTIDTIASGTSLEHSGSGSSVKATKPPTTDSELPVASGDNRRKRRSTKKAHHTRRRHSSKNRDDTYFDME